MKNKICSVCDQEISPVLNKLNRIKIRAEKGSLRKEPHPFSCNCYHPHSVLIFPFQRNKSVLTREYIQDALDSHLRAGNSIEKISNKKVLRAGGLSLRNQLNNRR